MGRRSITGGVIPANGRRIQFDFAIEVFHWQDHAAHWEPLYQDTDQVSACEFALDGALWVGTRNAGAIRIVNGKQQHPMAGSQQISGSIKSKQLLRSLGEACS